jgi:peptide deformylase
MFDAGRPMIDRDDTRPVPPPLVIMGEPRLAQPSVPVKPSVIVTPAFQARLETLQEAMVVHQGIGIAAPQIGWYERFFLMARECEGPDAHTPLELQTWINPEIVASSPERSWAWEGCLSVPDLRGWIRRPAAVAVRGYNARGERVSREYRGWEARVFQHEHDHLDGILFPYRAADPRHLVMTSQLERRAEWPPDWPGPGARDTPLGEVLPE